MKTKNLKIVIDGKQIIDSLIVKHGSNPILSSTYNSVKKTVDSINNNKSY